MFAQPFINLNGTVPEELIRQQAKRKRTLVAALEAHREAYPCVSDYRDVEFIMACDDFEETRIFLVKEIQKIETIIETIIKSSEKLNKENNNDFTI